MANSGDLIRVLSDVTGVSDSTLASQWRTLREKRLVSKAKRGAGAADVTATDSASSTIVLMGSAFDRVSADAVLRRYGQLEAARSVTKVDGVFVFDENGEYKSHHTMWSFSADDLYFSVPALEVLGTKHSLIECIAALIEAITREQFEYSCSANGWTASDIDYSIKIDMIGPVPSCVVSVSIFNKKKNKTFFQQIIYTVNIDKDRDAFALYLLDEAGKGPDLGTVRTITDKTLRAIANLLRHDFYNRKSPIGRPLYHRHPVYFVENEEERRELRQRLEQELDEREAIDD